MSTPYSQAVEGLMTLATTGMAIGFLSKTLTYAGKQYDLQKTYKTRPQALKHSKQLQKKGQRSRAKKGVNKRGQVRYGVYRGKK
jgi:hypothetical protein